MYHDLYHIINQTKRKSCTNHFFIADVQGIPHKPLGESVRLTPELFNGLIIFNTATLINIFIYHNTKSMLQQHYLLKYYLILIHIWYKGFRYVLCSHLQCYFLVCDSIQLGMHIVLSSLIPYYMKFWSHVYFVKLCSLGHDTLLFLEFNLILGSMKTFYTATERCVNKLNLSYNHSPGYTMNSPWDKMYSPWDTMYFPWDRTFSRYITLPEILCNVYSL